MLKFKTFLIPFLIVLLVGGTVFYFSFIHVNKENTDVIDTSVSQNKDSTITEPVKSSEPKTISEPEPVNPVIGTNPEVVKTDSSDTVVKTEVKIEPKKENTQNQIADSKIPQSNQTEAIKNGRLEYSSLNISTPILYSRLEDLFQKDSNGNINLKKPIQEDIKKGPLSTPVQKLLTKGVVHLAFSPLPGEIGNSYIVGHSSNYKSVKSNYNFIFEKLTDAKIGDEFTIYDSEGKELKFKVFENIAINGTDTEIAYKDYKDKSVVTLQASILVNFVPLKRRLVRGELVNKI